MMYITLLLIACLICQWIVIRSKRSEERLRADFHERLGEIWKLIHNGFDGYHVNPCIEEGVNYIKAASKKRKSSVRKSVQEAIRESYYYYLCMLLDVAEKRLAKEGDGPADDFLHNLFIQNHRWLELAESHIWPDMSEEEAKILELIRKIGTQERQALISIRDACEKRLEQKRTSAEKRRQEIEYERIRQKGMRDEANFWVDMALLGPPKRF